MRTWKEILAGASVGVPSLKCSLGQIHWAFMEPNYKMMWKNIEISRGRNQNVMSNANLFSCWRKNEDKYDVRYLVRYSSNSNVKLLNMPRNQSAIVPPCEQWKVSIDLAIRLNTLVKCSIHIAMKWYFVSGFPAIWSRQLNPDNPDNGWPITLKHGRVTSQSETQAPAQLMYKSRIYSKLPSSLIRKHVTYLLSIPKVIPIVPVLPVKCIYSVRSRDYRQGLLPKTIDHGRIDRAVAQLVI